jgi:hypothetical protein
MAGYRVYFITMRGQMITGHNRRQYKAPKVLGIISPRNSTSRVKTRENSGTMEAPRAPAAKYPEIVAPEVLATVFRMRSDAIGTSILFFISMNCSANLSFCPDAFEASRVPRRVE